MHKPNRPSMRHPLRAPAPVRDWLAPLMMTTAQRLDTIPTPEDLASCMRAVAASADRAAFAVLFRHFAPRIKAYLIRGGVPAGTAEDLAQEAMVRVWRKAASFDASRAQVSTWVFTIARNLRVDWLRRGIELPAGGFDSEDGEGAERDLDIVDEAPTPAEQALSSERARGVRAALEHLSPEQALIVRLSFYEDEPHAAIAQALGLPLGTVKSRIRLAIGRLRELLGDLQP